MMAATQDFIGEIFTCWRAYSSWWLALAGLT